MDTYAGDEQVTCRRYAFSRNAITFGRKHANIEHKKKSKLLIISGLDFPLVGITALLKISKNLSYRIFFYI